MQYRPSRWTISTPVILRDCHGEQEAFTHSVSSTGLRVHGVKGLTRGQGIEIDTCGTILNCRVIWASDTRAGLEFEQPQTKAALVEAGLRQP